MRKVKWSEVIPSEGGDYKRPQADGYVVTITQVDDHDDKMYLEVRYDIAEGEFKGYFSDTFYADKPYAHRFIASYTETADGMFRKFLDCLSASNPGFDAITAADACRPDMFVGKQLGVVFRDELYTKSNGKEGSRFSQLVEYRTVDQIRKHDYVVREPDDRRDASTKSGTQAKAPMDAYTQDNIPF